jgi:hypothetical protein
MISFITWMSIEKCGELIWMQQEYATKIFDSKDTCRYVKMFNCTARR